MELANNKRSLLYWEQRVVYIHGVAINWFAHYYTPWAQRIQPPTHELQESFSSAKFRKLMTYYIWWALLHSQCSQLWLPITGLSGRMQLPDWLTVITLGTLLINFIHHMWTPGKTMSQYQKFTSTDFNSS